MPTILITGGTGFIGSRLALACAERGEDVRVFAQRNTLAERQNCQQLDQHGIIIVEGSVTDPGAVARACEAVDVIYHLAAQHEANVPDKHYYDVNVQGTRNMLEAAVEAGVQQFVKAATSGFMASVTTGRYETIHRCNPIISTASPSLKVRRLSASSLTSCQSPLFAFRKRMDPGTAGCPAVVSKTGTCPEVVGDSALLADPHDATDIAQKIVAVINDENVRQTLRKKGLKRAATFTWDKTARLTLDALVGVVNNHRKPRE